MDPQGRRRSLSRRSSIADPDKYLVQTSDGRRLRRMSGSYSATKGGRPRSESRSSVTSPATSDRDERSPPSTTKEGYSNGTHDMDTGTDVRERSNSRATQERGLPSMPWHGRSADNETPAQTPTKAQQDGEGTPSSRVVLQRPWVERQAELLYPARPATASEWKSPAPPPSKIPRPATAPSSARKSTPRTKQIVRKSSAGERDKDGPMDDSDSTLLTLRHTVPSPEGARCACITDSQHLWIGGKKGRVNVYNTKVWNQVAEFTIGDGESVRCMLPVPGRCWIGCTKGSIYVCNTKDFQVHYSNKIISEDRDVLSFAIVHLSRSSVSLPDDPSNLHDLFAMNENNVQRVLEAFHHAHVLVSTAMKVIHCFHGQSFEHLYTIQTDYIVRSMTYVHERKELWTGEYGHGGSITVWALIAHRRTPQPTGKRRGGRVIKAIGPERTEALQVFTPVSNFPAHDDTVIALKTVSSLRGKDGGDRRECPPMVVSGSVDGTVKIWNCISRREKILSAQLQNRVYCLAYEAHSRLLLSGAHDQTLLLAQLSCGDHGTQNPATSIPVVHTDVEELLLGPSSSITGVLSFPSVVITVSLEDPFRVYDIGGGSRREVVVAAPAVAPKSTPTSATVPASSRKASSAASGRHAEKESVRHGEALHAVVVDLRAQLASKVADAQKSEEKSTKLMSELRGVHDTLQTFQSTVEGLESSLQTCESDLSSLRQLHRDTELRYAVVTDRLFDALEDTLSAITTDSSSVGTLDADDGDTRIVVGPRQSSTLWDVLQAAVQFHSRADPPPSDGGDDPRSHVEKLEWYVGVLGRAMAHLVSRPLVTVSMQDLDTLLDVGMQSTQTAAETVTESRGCQASIVAETVDISMQTDPADHEVSGEGRADSVSDTVSVDEYNALQEEVGHLLGTVERLSGEKGALEERVRTLQASVQSSERSVKEWKWRCEELHDERADELVEERRMRLRLQEEIERLSNERDHMLQHQQELEDEIRNIGIENRRLEKRYLSASQSTPIEVPHVSVNLDDEPDYSEKDLSLSAVSSCTDSDDAKH